MLRRVLLALALGLAVSCAVAQTAPSPADVGISKGTPDVFKLKGHDNAWTPFGSVDPSTHLFIPGTNGNIAPNDCVKWGPGLTSAGAACNSVTGGATPANQLTIYTSHVGLLANVTTPTEAWTVQQQGFYAPGDGGAATYQWSLTSYCTGGTSGAPTTADGIVCVLPVGQSASTAGRYLLQLGNGIDVRQIGMVGDGVTDNYPLVTTLMRTINPNNSQSSQLDVLFPAKAQQTYTDYYFSKSFHVNRPMHIRCQGIPNGGGDGSTRLVFPAGVHGVIFDNPSSFDGAGVPLGYAAGGMTSCNMASKGYHETYTTTVGSNVITSVAQDKWFGTWDFHVGDGIIGFTGVYGTPTIFAPIGPGGTAVTAVNSSTHALTLNATVPTGYGPGFGLWRLPVEDAFTVNTINGNHTVTVTGGPSKLQPGDYVWSDAFPFGTVVREVSGAVGAQTVAMTNYTLLGGVYENATKSETGGHLWIIPAGFKTFVGTNLTTNYFSSFPWGLEMECSSWGSFAAGCNGSLATQNQFTFSIIGRLVIGDNSGASTSLMNVYSYNSFADIAEMGAVGSMYLGDNANSQEASTAQYGIVGLCVNSNSSSFYGNYAPSNGGYCMNGIGVATSSGGYVTFFNPIAGVPYGAPYMANAAFANRWNFQANDAQDTEVCMNLPGTAIAWSRDSQTCGGPETWTLGYALMGFGGGVFMALLVVHQCGLPRARLAAIRGIKLEIWPSWIFSRVCCSTMPRGEGAILVRNDWSMKDRPFQPPRSIS